MRDWQRTCVYTCLLGRYEDLNEQPIAAQSSIPFLCLTDDGNLQSKTWRTVKIDPIFPNDMVRSQRSLKLLPHRSLPEFDTSLYIDNSVILKATPEEILERYLASSDFALPTHSYRDRVIDEFFEVARLCLDDKARISEQLAHYASSRRAVLDERPYWTAIMLRRHHAPATRRALELWAAHVLRYSRRDQLSANMAFCRSGLDPHRIEIDNYASWFHSWPHASGRDNSNRSDPAGEQASITHEWLRLLEDEAERSPATSQQLAAETIEHETTPAGLADAAARAPILLMEDEARSTVAESLQTPADFASCANGRRIYVHPVDERGKRLVLSSGDLNPTSLAMWRKLVAELPWTHVIDVGANYGEMLIGVGLPPSSTAFALEPNPIIVPYLRRTIDEAGLKVAVIAKAASAQSGMSVLTIDHDWSGLSNITGDQSQFTGHTIDVVDVPTITVASLITEKDRDRPIRLLIKIDVEGHEVAVLRGLDELHDELAEFAALVEILHATNADLEWLLAHFAVELCEAQTMTLTRVENATPTELRELLATKRYYAQDAVLRRRSRHPTQAR